MAPISLLLLLIGKASFGAVRGLFGSFAFIAVAKFLSYRVSYRRAILFRIGANLPGLISPGGCLPFCLLVSSGPWGIFSSLILLPVNLLLMTFLEGAFFSFSQVPVALKLAFMRFH